MTTTTVAPKQASQPQSKTGENERITHKVIASKVKNDQLMAFIYYVKVAKVNNGGEGLVVKNLDDDNKELHIQGKVLVENGLSADLYEEEVKVSKTKAAELLVSAYNRPLTVSFQKADGAERVLRGRLVQPEPLLGRSHVEDLDVSDKHRLRLVDHRTINYLILDGVKYAVK
jgi:hypothetical protein